MNQQDRRIAGALRSMLPEYTDPLDMITGYVDPATGTVNPDPLVGLAGTGLVWLHSEHGRSSVPAVIGSAMYDHLSAPGVRCKTGLNGKGERVAREPVDDNQNAPIIQQYRNQAQRSTYVDSRQFTPGLVTCHSPETGGSYGLFVYVQPLPYQDRVIQGALDVSALVPATTGERGLVVVYYDVSSAALGAVADTPSTLPYHPDIYNLERAVAIALGGTDRIRLGAVVLENGQTDIIETTPFVDCRDWLTLQIGTTTLDAPAITYTPTTAADWSVVPTDVQEALDGLAANVGGAGSPGVFTSGVAGTVIPGLAGSADISGAAGAGTAEEFDSGSSPLTWSAAPAVENVNSTIHSHLYLESVTNGELIGTKAWSPAGAFDVRAKVLLGSDEATNAAAIGVYISDSGDNARITLHLARSTADYILQAYTYASSTYTQRGASWSVRAQQLYLRVTRDGSNNISFYFSTNGLVWQWVATQAFTLTVANLGIRLFASSTSRLYAAVDWLRTDV